MNTFCKYCGSYDLTDTSDNVACRDCGCDQGIPQFVVGYDMVNHMEIMSVPKKAYCKALEQSVNIMQSFLKVPDTLATSAQKLLDDYMICANITVKCKDMDGFVAAAMYYVSRDTQIPLTLKKILDDCMIAQDVLSKSCTEINSVLTTHPNWTHLFHAVCENKREIAATSKIIQGLKLSSEDDRLLRSKLHKIHDRISGHQHVMSHHPTTLAATMVYSAAKLAKIASVTMTKVSKYSNITMASIISVEKVILNILKSVKK